METLFVLVTALLVFAGYWLIRGISRIEGAAEALIFSKLSKRFNKKGERPMEISKKIVKFLERHKIYYQVVVHPKTFTSMETAQAGHIPGRALAKVVMAYSKGKDIMVVIPSNRVVDLLKLSTALGTHDVRLEKEREFKSAFPGCEAGALPPLGPLYHMPCYVDETLKENEHIYLNAGNHEECLQVETRQFLKAVKAIEGDYSVAGAMLHAHSA